MAPLPDRTPDLITLDLLVTVSEVGTLVRSAVVHHMSRPSVSASARLARLEQRVGAPLLVRTAQGTFLTPAGETVVAGQVPEPRNHGPFG
jgi:DNA-binding transcriptional LysR family regulator